MISAIVLTRNEEKNIEACLDLLKWCEEIIIVDDYSTYKTINLLKSSRVKVFRRRLNRDFAAQRNFGLKQARGKWVFFVDADERISPALQAEIQYRISNIEYRNTNGFYLKRKDFFGGRWLRHGETAKVRLLRLAKKGAGEWNGKVHEVYKISGETGELKNPLLHYPHPTMTEFLEQINYYSDLRAEELYSQGIYSSLFQILGYPLAKFLQNWILRLGFLDGPPGFMVAMMMSWHSFLVRSKLYLKWFTMNK